MYEMCGLPSTSVKLVKSATTRAGSSSGGGKQWLVPDSASRTATHATTGGIRKHAELPILRENSSRSATAQLPTFEFEYLDNCDNLCDRNAPNNSTNDSGGECEERRMRLRSRKRNAGSPHADCQSVSEPVNLPGPLLRDAGLPKPWRQCFSMT